MAELQAGTKYEDWEGTASGDNAMKLSVEGWLRSKGLQSANEHLVAFALDSGENHGGSAPTIRMKTYLHAGSASFGDAKAYIDGEAGELTFKVVQTQMIHVGAPEEDEARLEHFLVGHERHGEPRSVQVPCRSRR